MFFHRFLSVPRMNFTFTLLSKTFERCERFFLFPPLFFFHVYVFLENFSISQVFFSLFFMFTFSYETFERWLIIKTRGWRTMLLFSDAPRSRDQKFVAKESYNRRKNIMKSSKVPRKITYIDKLCFLYYCIVIVIQLRRKDITEWNKIIFV